MDCNVRALLLVVIFIKTIITTYTNNTFQTKLEYLLNVYWLGLIFNYLRCKPDCVGVILDDLLTPGMSRNVCTRASLPWISFTILSLTSLSKIFNLYRRLKQFVHTMLIVDCSNPIVFKAHENSSLLTFRYDFLFTIFERQKPHSNDSIICFKLDQIYNILKPSHIGFYFKSTKIPVWRHCYWRVSWHNLFSVTTNFRSLTKMYYNSKCLDGKQKKWAPFAC